MPAADAKILVLLERRMCKQKDPDRGKVEMGKEEVTST